MPITYDDAVRACLGDPAFLEEYDRLRGTTFSQRGSIKNLIDQATGKYDADAKELAFFIRDHIWRPAVELERRADE